MSGSADAPVRIIVIGDQYAAGFGDPKALGWTGRVAARTLPQREIEVVTLAVPGETTSQMSDRWFAEFERRRATDIETRLVVALGPADIEHGLSLARSRLNLANILDVAIEKSLNPLVWGHRRCCRKTRRSSANCPPPSTTLQGVVARHSWSCFRRCSTTSSGSGIWRRPEIACPSRRGTA